MCLSSACTCYTRRRYGVMHVWCVVCVCIALTPSKVLALKGDRDIARARDLLFASQRVLSTLKRDDQREESANFLRLAEELDATLRSGACAYHLALRHTENSDTQTHRHKQAHTHTHTHITPRFDTNSLLPAASDVSAKVLYKMRSVGINEVLAGAKKKDAVARRVAMGQNEQLSEMYYNYRF